MRGAGIFASQCVWQLYLAVTCREITFVQGLNADEMGLHWLDDRSREHRDTIPPALSIAYDNLAIFEIDVLDA